MVPMLRGAALSMLAAALAATGAACSAPPAQRPATVTVMAAFYPLQYAAERVGGDAVSVVSLTPAGGEPHDVELSPQQVAEMGEADLVLYIKGFQPAVDEAVAQIAPERAVDVSQGITLLAASEPADGQSATQATDPHIWLDPLNMVKITDTITTHLSEVAPQSAPSFAENGRKFDDQLSRLDRKWSAGTATCSSRDLVVSHEAFGYLAQRYGFTQVGISGLSPEAEPSPAKVAEVTDFVRGNGVETIYFETLVDPKVAQTVAAETGARTAVLDPLEGPPAGSGSTYLTAMVENLDTVVAGQPCS